jgi:predicted metalloendopeptidase
MKKSIFTACIVFVLMLFAVAGHAGNDPLTDNQVENFISTMKEIHPMFEEYDDLDEIDDETIDPDNFEIGMAEEMEMLKGHEIYGRIENVVQNHGFSDIGEWGNTGDRIMNAFFSIMFEKDAPVARAQMEQAFRDIDENPYFSSDQKEEIKSKYKESTEKLIEAFLFAPEEDMEVVRRHNDALHKLFEELNDVFKYEDEH